VVPPAMRGLAVLATLLLVVACDSGREHHPSPQEGRLSARVDVPDPCSLLSVDQVAKAVGASVKGAGEVQSMSDAQGKSAPLCSYETASVYKTVTVSLDAPVTKQSFLERLGRDTANTQAVAIPGGELAYVHAGVSLSMLTGATVVTIDVQDFRSVEETRSVLRHLAQEAVAGLRYAS